MQVIPYDMSKIYFRLFVSIGIDDNVEAMDVAGSSLVLNAASYVLSSQLGDKVKLQYTFFPWARMILARPI